ncbi:thioredoxin-like protein [Kockovaella imperatae]|uniref:Thioredoxin-like protein n=1 Tax=Kockovaella imperatae TaxID=4999 RepID=A0A1Y1U8T2_9TREE|nr:thioredoxin-like protein [Kockovaella imperatae]ORX34422.1 thioredoxin-like protein [Kockovaella imperatae]
MAAELKSKVDKMIEENRVVVIGKSWCGFCRRARGTLERMVPDVTNWDIDTDGSESVVQDYLHKKTGQRTVPFVFINGEFIGGCDDLHRIPQPQLKQLINKKPAPSS